MWRTRSMGARVRDLIIEEFAVCAEGLGGSGIGRVLRVRLQEEQLRERGWGWPRVGGGGIMSVRDPVSFASGSDLQPKNDGVDAQHGSPVVPAQWMPHFPRVHVKIGMPNSARDDMGPTA